MKLTDKALEAFRKFIYDKYRYSIFEFEEHEIFVNALIIEWLDSVGIYISIPHLDKFGSFVNDEWCGDYPTRTEAINEAIVKANENFNTFEK